MDSLSWSVPVLKYVGLSKSGEAPVCLSTAEDLGSSEGEARLRMSRGVSRVFRVSRVSGHRSE